jgi:polyhydroxybutyrate depolymerase
LVATLFFIAPCAVNVAEADQILTLATADGPRQAILLPAQQTGPNPTIIILHSETISAQRMVRSSGFAEAAAVHGFNAVFPEGRQQLWNDAREGGGAHSDDVGFLNALAHQLIESKIADPARIYIAGVSNGGMMAFAMICHQDAPFAGIATIIAVLPSNLEQSCRPPKPIAVVMMNGTADPIMPFGGGHVGFFGRHGNVLGAERTAEIFAKAEDCTSQSQSPLPKRNATEKTIVKLVTWSSCAPQASVRLYEVEGGGHQIPGGPTFLPFLFGSPNHDIRAADAILEAFAGS